MRIRLLEKKDIKDASKIVGANHSKNDAISAAKEIREMFDGGVFKPVYFVADDNRTTVGFAGYVQSWIDYGIYQIFWVNVRPDRQKKGIGKKLVSKLISEIKKKKDARLIQLSATVLNSEYYKTHFKFKTVDRFGPKNQHLMTLAVRSKGK